MREVGGMKTNAERLALCIKSLPPGPVPRDIDATIKLSAEVLEDLSEEEFNITFENAMDELQSHIIIMWLCNSSIAFSNVILNSSSLKSSKTSAESLIVASMSRGTGPGGNDLIQRARRSALVFIP